MKKINLAAIMLFCGLSVFGQAVKDRNVIPVAVNLNQVLRMTITNGGNIEFVFNSIQDYKKGLSSQAASSSQNPATSFGFYKTDFTVSSSTRWALSYGAGEPSFVGADHPNPTVPFTLDNVGFTITNNGSNLFEGAGLAKGATSTASLFSIPTANATEVTALQVYLVVLIEDNNTVNANAGDAADNSFTLNWRAGTTEKSVLVPANSMNPVAIIDQNPSPAADRYVVNVLFDLAVN